MYISNWSKVMAKILYLTLKNDLDLIMLHSKCAALWDLHVHQMSISIGSNVMANVIYILTFDLEGWLDLDILPLKMCGFMRYTFLPNTNRYEKANAGNVTQKIHPPLKQSTFIHMQKHTCHHSSINSLKYT